jgi:hypothetical protein
MSKQSSKKFEFREWLNSQSLKTPQVTARFGISEQTARHWRSKGVPESRQDFVSRTIAEWADGSSIGPRIQIQATDAQFRAWNRAANECEGGPKLLEDWAREGLDQMAHEYFTNPQLSLALRSLPPAKVADEANPNATRSKGDVSYRKVKPPENTDTSEEA